MQGVDKPFPIAWVFLFCVAYILPGLIGHDPWKQDEAYTFGIVHHMVKSGDWVVPEVSGEPFLEKPPLFFLTAAILANVATVLPQHDGARLASGLFVAITLLALAWSARHSWGVGQGRNAVLLLLSSIGFIVHAHMMLTDLALTAGFAIAISGLIACAKQYRWGGIFVGLGMGMGFLAKGLLAPGVIGMTALVLPILFQEWRRRSYFRQLGIALLSALPWLTIWPIALYLRSPDLFSVWFYDNNVGRFIGFSVPYLGAENKPGFWANTYPWFLFPIWIFVIASFWRLRRDALRNPAIQVGMTLTLTLGLILGMAASARATYALPMLIPLSLAGVGSAEQLPPWVGRTLTALGLAIGVGAVALFWPIWILLTIRGHAPDWHWLTTLLPQEFAMHPSAIAILAAIVLTIGAIAWIAVSWQQRQRALYIWVGSLALTWGLAATLWLPWIDAAKSYRAMFRSMYLALPVPEKCLASRGLGESERAMLSYVLGINTERQELSGNTSCDALLIQSFSSTPRLPGGSDWKLVWSGARPADTRERFDLYLKGF